MAMKVKLFEFHEKPKDFPLNINSNSCSILFSKIDSELDITQSWIKGTYEISDKMIFYVESNFELINGIYRIKSILFMDPITDRYFYAMTNPFNFTINEYKVENNILVDATEEEAEKAKADWDESVRIGIPETMINYKYSEIYLICSDALITYPFRIGQAEIYPLSKSGIVDLSSSIKEVFLNIGERVIELNEILEGISHSDERRSPLFCIRFPRFYIESDSLTLPILPYVKKIFGLLCLNRGAYCKLLGGVHIRQKDEKKDVFYMNLNSYYRGNLVGGLIAKENANLFNKQYKLLIKDNYLTEIVSKLNSAYAETDLDISYFRLWSILECISNDLLGGKKLKHIKEIIQKAHSDLGPNYVIKLELGPLVFELEQLLKMWLNWRDITAHNGGINSFYEGKKNICFENKLMIEEMRKMNLVLDYGEDRSNLLLKDICAKVVEFYLNKAM